MLAHVLRAAPRTTTSAASSSAAASASASVSIASAASLAGAPLRVATSAAAAAAALLPRPCRPSAQRALSLLRPPQQAAAALSTAPLPFSDDAMITPTREWTRRSRRCGAVGMKCGMTMGWTAEGERLPLTVVELQDLQVTQVKYSEGQHALQLGGGWQKRKRLSATLAKHFEARGLPLKAYLREFKVTEDALLPVGTSITARHFVPGQYVDVQGVTRGKGFQGVMKRWGFGGQPRTHGVSKYHRGAGSSGGAAGAKYATRVRKGKRMAGRMGNKRRTVLSLPVFKVDAQHNLLFLVGSLPGGRGSVVRLRDAHIHKRRFTDTPPPFPTFLPGDEEGGEGEAQAAAA